jgi:hypothetical protein
MPGNAMRLSPPSPSPSAKLPISILIYLDTNIWNALCDQGVESRALVESLGSKRASLVLSFHTVYELARTFMGSGGGGAARGVRLFSYLKGFLDLNIPCSKEVMELLQAEAWAFKQGRRAIETLLHGDDYATVSHEVDKLARGIVKGRVEDFIQQRIQFAESTRSAQVSHFIEREGVKQKLKAVPESQLAQWLAGETMTPAGADILCGHLTRLFGRGPTRSYASALLASPVANVARGLVRADLYYNWRCANRGSNPADLMDDMLHVLQAAYCDVYVTGEAKQSEYARLLLPASTCVVIYDHQAPVGQLLGCLA